MPFKPFLLDAKLLFNYLTLRTFYGQIAHNEIPDLSTIQGWVQEVYEKRLLRRLRHIQDDKVEQATVPSDVANTRDYAWSTDHAQEMSTPSDHDAAELQVAYDSVAVFEQSVVGTQGQILQATQALLEKGWQR